MFIRQLSHKTEACAFINVLVLRGLNIAFAKFLLMLFRAELAIIMKRNFKEKREVVRHRHLTRLYKVNYVKIFVVFEKCWKLLKDL